MSDTSTKVALGTVGVIGLVTIIGFVSGMMEGKIHNNKATPASVGGAHSKRHTRRKHRTLRNRTRRA